jgi:hypothetical protein
MQLTKEQFLEWRLKIEKLLHAETKVKLSNTILVNMEKDVEIQKLRAIVYKAQVRTQQEEYSIVKEEYEAHKKELENVIGMSLSDCTIDEFSYEVKKLDC